MSNRSSNLQSHSLSGQELKRARRSLLAIGFCFIFVGVWALVVDLPLGESMRGFAELVLAFIDQENRAPTLYFLCIATGIILILMSFMKPYSATNKKTHKH